jgi:hypothetical protein
MLLCWRRRAPGGNGWARNGCRVHRSQQPQKRGNSSGMALCTPQHTNRSGTAAATAAGRYLGERSGRRSSRHQQVRGKQLLVGSNRYKKVASGSNREPGKRNRATGKWEQDQLWYNRYSKHSPKWNVKQNPSVVCKSRLYLQVEVLRFWQGGGRHEAFARRPLSPGMRRGDVPASGPAVSLGRAYAHASTQAHTRTRPTSTAELGNLESAAGQIQHGLAWVSAGARC